jgi:hypothetical protein
LLDNDKKDGDEKEGDKGLRGIGQGKTYEYWKRDEKRF